MAPDLSVSAYVYLTVLIVIPIVILGCVTPLYVVVDKVRSQGKASTFYDRWLYNGSSEIGICLLSLTLLISVATSTKPAMHYFYNQPSYKVHNLELFGLSGAVICIGILTGIVFFRYGLKKDGKGIRQDLFTSLVASVTLLAPGFYFFLFRLPWKTA